MNHVSVFIACALTLLAHANNVWAHELEPGLYEIEVQVELPNILHPAHNVSSTRCITRDDLLRHDPFQIESKTPLANCRRTPICMGGTHAGFEVLCDGGSGGMASGRFTLSKSRFTGTIEMNMGGKNMTVVERQTGTRIGDCRD